MGERPAVGILGGTFDPIHCGHLLMAREALESLGLAHVAFMPAANPPHKSQISVTDVGHRTAMVMAAIRGQQGFRFDDLDLRDEGPSYTIALLERLRQRSPSVDPWLIIGADSLADLPTWHRPADIARLTRVAVAPRPDVTIDLADLIARIPTLAGRVTILDMPAVGFSSTDIRDRVSRGRTITYHVPDDVSDYIRRHGLYRSGM